MRIKSIKLKIAEEVVIGDDLQRFFKTVDDLIKQNDYTATTESDDLIQTEFVYGGLIEEGNDLYGFTYFPEQKTRHKWEIALTASEIEAISSGKKKSLTLWKCQNPDCRSFFSWEDESCSDCDYVDDDDLAEKKRILSSLPQGTGREDWAKAYLANFPDADPFEVISDYNSQPQLGEKWGYFSLDEMRALIEKQKNQSNTNPSV